MHFDKRMSGFGETYSSLYLPQFDILQFSHWVTALLAMYLVSRVSQMDQSMWDIRRNWTITLPFKWMIRFPLILALSGACIFLANTTCSLCLGSDARQLAEGEILEENKLISDKQLSELVCFPPTLTFSVWQAPQNWLQRGILFKMLPCIGVVKLSLYSSSQIYSHREEDS